MKASVKYQVVYRHREKYSIFEMCRFFKVSRSGYYDFVRRLERTPKDEELAGLIGQCQESCKRTYGYRRVAIWLDRNGVHHNPKTVLRVMQKYGLLSVIRRRKYQTYSSVLHRYPNTLNRDFHADRPNQKWVTDISYIRTGQGFLYLSVIRDLYDLSIVSYRTSPKQTVNLVLDTIRDAKAKEKVTDGLALHSDQGFQYLSQEYFNLTISYHISPSMSRRGNPYDNALAENFFSILKTECIHRIKLRTFSEAEQVIDEYIHFYNHVRLQSKTKLTPVEFRNQFCA